MSAVGIALLGAIAGFTIFLGLPLARVRNPSMGLRALLNATAAGILLFLLWDVLTHGIEPVESALTAATPEAGCGSPAWPPWSRLASAPG
jgi:zinc transporter, ZIP family